MGDEPMRHSPLRPTAFRGDPDVAELHAFFQPERQYAGDTRWTFGTSLKSAYVNTFEFLNHPPVVQLWRDQQGDVQAVSRIMLATGEWFYQAAPGYRCSDGRDDVSIAILEQADAAMGLLAGLSSWCAGAYESDAPATKLLEGHGYRPERRDEVYMTRSLETPIAGVPSPVGCSIRTLDPDDARQVFERGDAQTDAFAEGQPRNEIAAWMTRTLPHQLGYGGPNRNPSVIAVEPDGRVLAFADPFFDHTNKIGEFEPVGTRKQMHRRGLAKAVLTRGLELMKDAGMRQAVVRTGFDNHAAITAYRSVGFDVTDYKLNYRKVRVRSPSGVWSRRPHRPLQEHRHRRMRGETLTNPAPYLPHGLFMRAGLEPPRVLIAPQRYIQGDGVLDQTGRYLSLVNSQRVGILISRRGQHSEGARLLKSLESVGIESVVATFNGECSLEEIDRQAAALRSESPAVDCLLAVGGGKCVDAGKCIAYRLNVPLVVVPTLASNDAPCSAVSVLYTPDGVTSGIEFFPTNPALVVVDTGVVAQAPERFLVAGMGDAMATYYEAKVCLDNPRARTTIGARPTLAACALGKTCADTLYSLGTEASRSVVADRVDDALEQVVEANTLLSGVGFESGGLAIAHAIAQGYTAIKPVHDNHLHGEMVAMGLLTQLIAERDVDEARRAARFFCDVGLPVHLEQISLAPDRSTDLDTLVGVAIGSGLVQNMPFEVTHELLLDAVVGAHRLGREVAAAQGDSAYRRLQAG